MKSRNARQHLKDTYIDAPGRGGRTLPYVQYLDAKYAVELAEQEMAEKAIAVFTGLLEDYSPWGYDKSWIDAFKEKLKHV